MSGTTTLDSASVHQVAGLIAIPIIAIISVILLTHWIFDVIPTASALAGTGVQRRKASTTGDQLTANHTPLAHTTLLLAHHSGRKLTRDTAHTLSRGCY
jgi:hypothetical protein